MHEYLWLPCVVTIAAIALSTILIKEFLKKIAGQIAGEGGADNDSATKNGTVESAACTCTSPPVNEMATFSGSDYEVFLSFRGPDTRVGFTDFLYTSLKDVGICTFRDDEELRVGEEFAPELLQAIKQSKILIPIFSKGYASSIWCLKELAQMVECQKIGRQKIMPIFYDVRPSEVRHQIGSYGEAFLSHKRKGRYDQKTIGEWKDALKAVARINGWDLQSMLNRQEGQLVKTVTQKVFNELKKAYLVVSDCLVNVDNHVDPIMKLIGLETSETRIIGIYGMGGIGKTTIAKIIYNQLSEKFEGCCFLSNIREMSDKGIEFLQNQLISDILKKKCIDIRNVDDGLKIIKDRFSNKRVLLLLDDVHEKKHMDALAGERDWFGKGSKLIITTRNKEVLDVLKVDDCYELLGMDDNQSLQLFSKHAFRRDYPLDEYIDQSQRAIKIAGGLPLALETMGSLLSCIEKKKWDSKLAMLESDPPKDVQSKLKISYDVLGDKERKIFLDIACLFIGYDKDIMIHYWESEFHSEDAMDVLENMSLIKIKKDNKVWMHDQLKDFGRQIVCRQIICREMNINKQIRVWDPEKAFDLLKKYEEKEEVEALYVEFDHQHRFTYEDFKSLPNLTFLRVNDWKENSLVEKMLLWLKRPLNVLPTNVFQKNSNLLPRLRWLSWHNICLKFEIANFSMENVIILDLSWSDITHDWKGWSHMKVIKNLKVLNLAHCQRLRRTPNFSAHSNLERLILSECESLIKIDRSICQLKRLVFLDLSGCGDLQRLPDKLGVGLLSLEYLSLQGCCKLNRLPKTIGNLESLTKLDISEMDMEELPDSIGKLKNLKVVKMQKNYISEIPDAFWMMEKLEKIDFSLHVFSISRFEGEIGTCIYENKSLRILRLGGVRLRTLPRLPESLTKLKLQELSLNTFPDLSNLTDLKELHLDFGPPDYDGKSDGLMEEFIPRWIENLSKLESLELRFAPIEELRLQLCFASEEPWWIENSSKLESLELRIASLEQLRFASPTDLTLPPHPRRLPTLPSSLSYFCLSGCYSLCSMDLSNLKKLSSLLISDSAVAEIQGLGCLENLRDLYLGCLGQVVMLPDLSKLKKLRRIAVRECGNLVEIQGELPRFLDELRIDFCPSLQALPDLFSLMGKTDVHVHGCGQALEIAVMDRCQLVLSGFKQMQILPDLSNSNKLKILHVINCGNLIEIPGELPQFLDMLLIESCESLQRLPDLSSSKRLRHVMIDSCPSLQQLPGLFNLLGETRLFISRCDQLLEFAMKDDSYLLLRGFKQMQILPDLSNLNKLEILKIDNCGNLIEIQGKLPQSLIELQIESCESLQKLPDLSSLKGLKKVVIRRCRKLPVEEISWLCSKKRVEFVEDNSKEDESVEEDKFVEIEMTKCEWKRYLVIRP